MLLTAHIGKCEGRTRRVCWWRWVQANLWSTASPCRPRQRRIDHHTTRRQGPTPPSREGTVYETSPLIFGKDQPERQNNRRKIKRQIKKMFALLFTLTTKKPLCCHYLVQTLGPQVDQGSEDAGRKRLSCLLDIEEKRNPEHPLTFHLHQLQLPQRFRDRPTGDRDLH